MPAAALMSSWPAGLLHWVYGASQVLSGLSFPFQLHLPPHPVVALLTCLAAPLGQAQGPGN